MKENKISSKTLKWNSFGLSIFLCANPLSWIFPLDNVIALIIASSIFIILLNNNIMLYVNKLLEISPFLIILLYLFLFSFININSDQTLVINYFYSFILFGISAFVFATTSVNFILVFKYIGIISFLLIPTLYYFNFGNAEFEKVDYGAWMGISYGTLRFINALIICITFKEFELKLKPRILAIITLVFYLNIYVNYASRGAFVSILVFCLILIAIYRKQTLKHYIFLLIAGTSLVLMFSSSLFSFIEDTLGKNLYSINKMLRMYMEGDITNGRSNLFMKAWQGFVESPLWGNGLGVYEPLNNGYSHNLILQVLFEGGLILFVPLIIILLTSISIIINSSNSKIERVFILFLFCSGIIELLFSSIHWNSHFFWYFVFVIYYKIKHKNKNYENFTATIQYIPSK